MNKCYAISVQELKNFIQLFNSFDFTNKFDKEINTSNTNTMQKLNPNKIDEYLKQHKYKFIPLKTLFNFLDNSTKKLSNQALLAIAQTILDNK